MARTYLTKNWNGVDIILNDVGGVHPYVELYLNFHSTPLKITCGDGKVREWSVMYIDYPLDEYCSMTDSDFNSWIDSECHEVDSAYMIDVLFSQYHINYNFIATLCDKKSLL